MGVVGWDDWGPQPFNGSAGYVSSERPDDGVVGVIIVPDRERGGWKHHEVVRPMKLPKSFGWGLRGNPR